jgi:hypothetical protein
MKPMKGELIYLETDLFVKFEEKKAKKLFILIVFETKICQIKQKAKWLA